MTAAAHSTVMGIQKARACNTTNDWTTSTKSFGPEHITQLKARMRRVIEEDQGYALPRKDWRWLQIGPVASLCISLQEHDTASCIGRLQVVKEVESVIQG